MNLHQFMQTFATYLPELLATSSVTEENWNLL